MKLSLHQRLLAYLLSATLLGWLVVAVASVAKTRSEVEQLFDAKLAQSAWVLWSLVSHELREEGASGKDGHLSGTSERLEELASHLGPHKYESPVAFQIWIRDGDFRFHSASAPERALAGEASGFSDSVVDGVDWRVFSHRDAAADVVVRVAERRRVREELVDQVAWQFVLPLIAGLPLLAIVIWKCVDHGVRPLSAVADAVRSRHPAHLDRIDMEEVPGEVVPLVSSLNRLFGRIESMLDSERRFTSHAAHELRSPLTALKTHAQVAMRTADDDRRQQALARLDRGVDRTIHLIEQMLTLARVEPEGAVSEFDDVALGALVQEVTADLAADALGKHIDIGLEDTETGTIRGNADALQILARNVIDNAIRYTPDGGSVAIRTEDQDDGTVALVVADSGPGIPAEERTKVFQRFYRRGGNRVPGSGLGLSIAKGIADLHAATVSLGTSPAGGLETTVRFPRVAG